jgi:uncharacterized phage-associated protein
MNPIRFDFSQEKFQELMLWLAEQVSQLDRLKAAKLLYLVDRECLLKTGRPLLGDVYFKMNLGPVPSTAYDCLKKIRARGSLFFLHELQGGADPYPIFVADKPHDESVFSQAEIECIESTVARFGELAPTALSDITHGHRTWTQSVDGSPIDYRLFFDDPNGEQRHAFEAMLLDQEDRDFTSNF